MDPLRDDPLFKDLMRKMNFQRDARQALQDFGNRLGIVAARRQFADCQVFAPRLSTITPALDSCSRSLIAKHQLLHATRQLQARSQSPRLLIGSLAGLVPAETGPEPTARA